MTSVLRPDGSRILPTLRANLIAASLASVPELQKKTLEARDLGIAAQVFSIMSFEAEPVQAL